MQFGICQKNNLGFSCLREGSVWIEDLCEFFPFYFNFLVLGGVGVSCIGQITQFQLWFCMCLVTIFNDFVSNTPMNQLN